MSKAKKKMFSEPVKARVIKDHEGLKKGSVKIFLPWKAVELLKLKVIRLISAKDVFKDELPKQEEE